VGLSASKAFRTVNFGGEADLDTCLAIGITPVSCYVQRQVRLNISVNLFVHGELPDFAAAEQKGFLKILNHGRSSQ
jgi:hypothetical protein